MMTFSSKSRAQERIGSQSSIHIGAIQHKGFFRVLLDRVSQFWVIQSLWALLLKFRLCDQHRKASIVPSRFVHFTHALF